MKLVQLNRQTDDSPAEVVVAVGPMPDADADAYASELEQLVGQHTDLGLSVGTTSVESVSGETAEPPADPAELMRALLAGAEGAGGSGHEIPEPDPGG